MSVSSDGRYRAVSVHHVVRIGLAAAMAAIALGGLTTCSQLYTCKTGDVAFTLPSPDDSLGFDVFFCVEGGKGGGPSFAVSVTRDAGDPAFEVEFIDPTEPELSGRSSLFETLSSRHCEEGVRVEIYRDDAMPVSSSGFIRTRLSMRNPDVCTIDFKPVEEMR